MDRGAWQATVHGVAKGRTLLKPLKTQRNHPGWEGMPRLDPWAHPHLLQGGGRSFCTCSANGWLMGGESEALRGGALCARPLGAGWPTLCLPWYISRG